MPDAGLLLRGVAILLAVACYGSFAWAVVALFQRSGPTPPAMRWVGILGTGFFALQMVALVMGDPAALLTTVGIMMYVGSLAFFWWAVPHARAAKLALAFTESRSAVLLREGPYRLVRHPFYSAYLLFWLAGPVAAGEPWLLVSVLVMGAFYLSAVQREERELLRREDLPGYSQYQAKTGCLVPRWPSRS